MQQEDYESALKQLNRAHTELSKLPWKNFQLGIGAVNAGICYYNMRQYNNSQQMFSTGSLLIERSAPPLLNANVAYAYACSAFANSGDLEFEKQCRYLLSSTAKLPQNQETLILVANTYASMILGFMRHQNFDSAIEIGKSALKLYLSLLGKNHPKVAILYLSLATAYLKIDKLTYAASYLDEAAEIYANTYIPIGSQSPRLHLIQGYISVGYYFSLADSHKSGLQHFRKALSYLGQFSHEELISDRNLIQLAAETEMGCGVCQIKLKQLEIGQRHLNNGKMFFLGLNNAIKVQEINDFLQTEIPPTSKE